MLDSKFRLMNRFFFTFALIVFSFVNVNAQTVIQSFLAAPLGLPLNSVTLQNSSCNKYKASKYYFKNKQGVYADTVFIFKTRGAVFYINKNENGFEQLIYGNITSEKVCLANPVRINMTQNDFINHFNVNPKDTIIIKDNTLRLNYLFIFKNDKLQAIQINNKYKEVRE